MVIISPKHSSLGILLGIILNDIGLEPLVLALAGQAGSILAQSRPLAAHRCVWPEEFRPERFCRGIPSQGDSLRSPGTLLDMGSGHHMTTGAEHREL